MLVGKKLFSNAKKLIKGSASQSILLIVVFIYLISGAFIFRELELPTARKALQARVNRSTEIHAERTSLKKRLLIARRSPNSKEIILLTLKEYHKNVSEAVANVKYDGTVQMESEPLKWSVASAFLLTLTLLAGIGYGHVFPSTETGQIFCIGYCLVGIPLFLLFLANIGNLMAMAVRYTYVRGCCFLFRKRRFSTWTRDEATFYAVQRSLDILDERRSQRKSKVPLGRFSVGNQQVNSKKKLSRRRRAKSKLRAVMRSKGSKTADHPREKLIKNEVAPYQDTSHVTTRKWPTDAAFQPSARPDTAASTKGEPLEISTMEQWEEKTASPAPGPSGATFEDTNVNRYLSSSQTVTRFDIGEPGAEESASLPKEHEVPVILSISVIVIYILIGTGMYSHWEGWSLTQSAYFTFITLSTIGLGDLVPTWTTHSTMAKLKMVFSTFYIVMGLAVLSMCFNLMIESVAKKLRSVKRSIAKSNKNVNPDMNSDAVSSQSKF